MSTSRAPAPNDKIPAVNPRAGTMYATVAAARSATALDVPWCPGVQRYYSPRGDVVYGTFDAGDDLSLVVGRRSSHPIDKVAPGTQFVAQPEEFQLRGSYAYGWEADPTVEVVSADGTRSHAIVRSYVAWSEGNVTIELASKAQQSLHDLRSLAGGCSIR